KAVKAAREFEKFDQQGVDKIVEAVYHIAFDNRIHLARMAYKETGIGILNDKILKNVIATRFVYRDIKNLKTVGIISEDHDKGIMEIARPLGPVFAITPLTNPTSTVLFKILISLKSRNPIIISPHGAARKSSIEAAKICYETAVDAGAPENCIQWLKRTSKEEALELMGNKNIAMVLATGSVGLVRAAYSSGNPAIGIGPGNVPVYIDKETNPSFAVEQIFVSKTFDNGTICASEQALVVHQDQLEEVINEFKFRKAYFLSEEEIKKLEPIAFNKTMKVMNVEVIGKSAHVIARMAGFEVPTDTTLLIAPLNEVGMHAPLSFEILAPILAFYSVEDFEAGLKMCKEINIHGGLGHTVSIFTSNEENLKRFALELNAGRVVVNTPSSQGAMGGTYNTLTPSLTLACGTPGKNTTSDNISAKHLLNIQRIARRRFRLCANHLHECHYLDENINSVSIRDVCLRHYE
ncbi:aldehyde dehydrogenase family protein, partial [Bacteroidota bacterium]